MRLFGIPFMLLFAAWVCSSTAAAEPARLWPPGDGDDTCLFGACADPPAPSWPAEDVSTDRPRWKRNLFRRVLSDQKFLVTRWWPAEIRRPQFSVPLFGSIALALGSGGGGADLRVQRSSERWGRQDGREPVARVFSKLGDVETAIVLIGGTYLVGRFSGHDGLRRTTSLSAEALLNSAIYSSVVKGLTRRTRPSRDGTGRFFVDNPEANQQATSFPSGHATGAFAVATVITYEYRHRRWVAWVAYGAAGLIATSRLALGRHFPSDVIAGAFLGRSIGRMVIVREDGLELPTGRRSTWRPTYDPGSDSYGLIYQLSW